MKPETDHSRIRKATEKGSVLLIEDDQAVAESLQQLLEDQNYLVAAAVSAEEGLGRARTANFDVVVTDWQLSQGSQESPSGLDVIKTLRRDRPELPVVLITGADTTYRTIEASKEGAFNTILKPINPEDLLELIEKAMAGRATASSPAIGPKGEAVPGSIIGRSNAMLKVYKEIGRVAARPVTVLIRGETGTGKELVARALHCYGDRAEQPFIIVNCVAIPEALLESELFGYEQGAFTGAEGRRIGKLEQANQGTVFLDEIGDMSLDTQTKLLRVLQGKSIQRVGGKEPINVDVRILAATHRDLELAVEHKEFRKDLYYRLNDAVIHLPPLRQRTEDIPALVTYFLSLDHSLTAAGEPSITPEAVRLLQRHSWPGNVRELRNVVHKALLLAQGRAIDPEVIRIALTETSLGRPGARPRLQGYVEELLDEAEREGRTDVEAALNEWAERELYGQAILLANGDQTKVTRWLGVSRPTVRERLRHYGFHPAEDQAVTKDTG